MEKSIVRASYKVDFALLKKEIKALGLHKNNAGRSLIEYFSHIILHLLFIWLCVFFDNLLLSGLFMYIATLSAIGITTTTHTASHNRISNDKITNDFLVYLGYGVMFGASTHYWKYKHLTVHHHYPNIVGVDADIDVMPFFALNTNEIKYSPAIRRFFYKMQWIVFPFALLFNLFNVQKAGWVYLIKKSGKEGFTRKQLIDYFSRLLHYVCWIIIPLFFFNILSILLLYFIRSFCISLGMFAALAPAHFPKEAKFLSIENVNEDYIKRQIYSTINYKTGIVGRYILGGLEFQIEHHLFPNLPQYNYPKVSKLVKVYCDKHQFPYHSMSWVKGIWESFKVFKSPKEVYESIYG
jgi:linoleoyl-CoA desaturase